MKLTEAAQGSPSPAVRRIVTLLDRLPADEVITTKELAARLRLSASWVTSVMGTRPAVARHTAKVRNVRFWGSPKAISELIRLTR
jgi:hypothetical protein